MNDEIKTKLKKWRGFVDGDADSPYEYFMLLVIIVNTVSLGIETSKNISSEFRYNLFLIDKICSCLFIIELLFKAIVYNKNFFGEIRKNEDGIEYFHLNNWNISDLVIIIILLISSLSYFSILRAFRIFRSFKVMKALRSLRIVKTLKLVNDVSALRTTFKGLVRAIPGILWTFCFLALFAYVYAIIGINVFGDDFPELFGTLGHSLLTLCQILTFDAWFSQIARPIIKIYPAAWVYFVTYAFSAASVIMNVIVGIIVDSIGKERNKQKRRKMLSTSTITLEKLSIQISELQNQIEELKAKL